MEKMKEFIKKNDNLIVFLGLIFMLIGCCFNNEISINDELWNFNNLCKIVNGYKIYRDINVIVTPFFYFCGWIIFKICEPNIFCFRVYNLTICSFMLEMIYLILKKCGISIKRSLIYTIGIFFAYFGFFRLGANYNMLALDFILIGIFYNLHKNKQHKINNFIEAAIVFLIFITKQNIGIYYGVGYALYQIIIHKKITKDNFIQLFIFIIMLICLGLVLFCNGILYDFINMTILGIKEFAYNNNSDTRFGFLLIFIWTLMGCGSIYFINRNLKTEKDKLNDLILIFSISIFTLYSAYPIFNKYHYAIAFMCTSLYYIIFLDYSLISQIINKKVEKNVCIILTTIGCIISVFESIIWVNKINNDSTFSSKDHYFGAIMNEETKNKFFTIEEFIKKQDKDVIVFSYEAALYLIPLEKNYGIFDLPFYGNMGVNGEEISKNKMNQLTNVIFLIKKDENELFWQESINLNNYIRNNMEKIGEIESFEIYQK